MENIENDMQKARRYKVFDDFPYIYGLSLLVPAAGVEPALPLGERDFKSRASANSAMPAGI